MRTVDTCWCEMPLNRYLTNHNGRANLVQESSARCWGCVWFANAWQDGCLTCVRNEVAWRCLCWWQNWYKNQHCIIKAWVDRWGDGCQFHKMRKRLLGINNALKIILSEECSFQAQAPARRFLTNSKNKYTWPTFQPIKMNEVQCVVFSLILWHRSRITGESNKSSWDYRG